jgi:hypothetical protein
MRGLFSLSKLGTTQAICGTYLLDKNLKSNINYRKFLEARRLA